MGIARVAYDRITVIGTRDSEDGGSFTYPYNESAISSEALSTLVLEELRYRLGQGSPRFRFTRAAPR